MLTLLLLARRGFKNQWKCVTGNISGNRTITGPAYGSKVDVATSLATDQQTNPIANVLSVRGASRLNGSAMRIARSGGPLRSLHKLRYLHHRPALDKIGLF
jgi:hypothetical protein